MLQNPMLHCIGARHAKGMSTRIRLLGLYKNHAPFEALFENAACIDIYGATSYS